ncbi:unnamed protein product [Amaranthus hypochondriacus]
MGRIMTSMSCKNQLNLMIQLFYIAFLLFTIAKSEVITVGGDENRWTDGFNYVSWAQNFNFSVGDVLVFNYVQKAHNVYDVTKETFRTCNTSNGVNAMYTSGDDHVELKEAKQYWFICTVDSHCLVGMKFTINVTRNLSSSIPLNDGNFAFREQFVSWVCLLVGILYILVIIV